MGGISAPGLKLRGIVDEGADVGRRIGHEPGGDRVAACNMGQIRAKPSGGDGPSNGMAADAGVMLKYGLSLCDARALSAAGCFWRATQAANSAGVSA